MNSYRGPFRLNKADGKMMGVCAGLSDHFDVDVTIVRIAMVLALVLTFPIAGFAYLAIALVADGKVRRSGDYPAPRLSPDRMEETRARMRELDARMQAMESYAVSSNSQLAREIDELR
jgi:phage shock protein C